ncbi:MAG: Trk system potassium transporter TrkA [Veillonella sp.]|uniref:Trk system potassium transporter TrkA n=1 Tax=Veillonella sp. TaxID=1926307 RepID=UPI0025FF974E|nr:Trk system potassium transporter TrkA [Veillonella sp.]MBS4912682.1 Trk system potassium transporter TrkA [Veillonella sp.]
MKIIVVGAGKVGYSVAQRLVQDEHDVYIIEKSAERIRNLENSLDVSIVQGNGTSLRLLQEIGMDDVGMLIAVTDSDEVNMLACSVAKIAGVPRTIARVRDNEYLRDGNSEVQERLGVDLFINPELVTAQELVQILQTPAALDVEDFASGAVRLMEFKVSEDVQYVGKKLRDIRFPAGVLIVGILRNGEMIIPHGESQLLAYDKVFILGSKDSMEEVTQEFHEENMGLRTKRVVLVGAGLIGCNLAILLERAGFIVKVIEKDLQRCEYLANQVNNTMVINGDGTNMDLLEAEEISDSDAIICLTNDDKLNLLVALLAKHLGVPKTIVRVGRPEYIVLMEQVGIDIVFSPRLLTSGEILRMVRRGENVLNISTFEGSKAEAVEVELSEVSPLVNCALKDLRLPGKALIGAIVRNGATIVPTGNTVLEAQDHIIFFTLPDYVNKLLTYLQPPR